MTLNEVSISYGAVRSTHASISQAHAHAHIKDRALSKGRAKTCKITLQQHYYYAIETASSLRHVRKDAENSQPDQNFASLNNTRKIRPKVAGNIAPKKFKLQDTLNYLI